MLSKIGGFATWIYLGFRLLYGENTHSSYISTIQCIVNNNWVLNDDAKSENNWLSLRGSPVSLPDVQRLLVHVVVSQRLFVQEVKEVFDGRRNDGARTQHAAEEIVHKLLQGALKKKQNNT